MRGNDLSDAVIDSVEVGIDRVSPELLKTIFGDSITEILTQLPVLKWGVALSKVIGTGLSIKGNKRLLNLYASTMNGTANHEELAGLSKKEAARLRIMIIDLMDHQVYDRQLAALRSLLDALSENKISKLIFRGLMHELRYINPLAYEPTAIFKILPMGKNWRRIDGPLHYLPSPFISNQNEVFQFTSDNLLTDLGEAFFDFVYPRASTMTSISTVKRFSKPSSQKL